MSKKIWYEETIKQYIENEKYIFIKLLTDKGLNSRIMIWCGNSKHKPYEVKFSNFKNGKRCPYCSNERKSENMKFTYEYVKEYIESFEYKLLSTEYENNRTKLLIVCPLGHQYQTTFIVFKNKNSRCPYCCGNIKFTYEEVKTYIEGFGYKLLSTEYKDTDSKLLIKCPNPNHEPYNVKFDSFKNQNNRCQKCAFEKNANKQRYTYEYIREYIESFGFKLLSTEYENCKTKLLIQCKNGHNFFITWNDFQQGRRCPKCNISKGEKEIENILNKYNIQFISQYRFKDCKFKQYLPFDFYLPQYNILIEFDGEQHYEIKDYFGGLDGFIDRVIRDTIKNEYCKKNNIKLIRIPYWEFNNIEKILKLNLK